jgi:hypothetical protein
MIFMTYGSLVRKAAIQCGLLSYEDEGKPVIGLTCP